VNKIEEKNYGGDITSLTINGRDVYEVANQLDGHVDESTPVYLAQWLHREAKASADLADVVCSLFKLVKETLPVLENVRDELDGYEHHASGESYNNIKLNDTIEMLKEVLEP
jgi:hypothetical protein